MIYLLLACLLVALLIYPSQVRHQVNAQLHYRKQATPQPSARLKPYTNGVASSPTVYQPAHTPSQGTAQGRS